MRENKANSAIILGTVGNDPQKLFSEYPGMSLSERQGPVWTPYADIYYYMASGCGLNFYVMERHNATGKPKYPHQLDLTAPAIMYFLTQIREVNIVVSTGAVGAAIGNVFLEGEIEPGTIVVPRDFMDFSGRETTFASGDNIQNKNLAGAHCPAGECTICTHLRNTLVSYKLAHEAKIALNRGTLSCVPGPRFETEAEKRALCKLGADLFGMHTTQRDWSLCQELRGVHFLPLLHVTNMVFENPNDTGFDVNLQAKKNFPNIMNAFFRVLRAIGNDPITCTCHERSDIFDHITIQN